MVLFCPGFLTMFGMVHESREIYVYMFHPLAEEVDELIGWRMTNGEWVWGL